MTLYAGSVASFTGSMAEAIETAFAAELLALKGTTLSSSSVEERRMLFCAIAQGVLGYLAANEASLTVTIGVTANVDIQFQVSSP